MHPRLGKLLAALTAMVILAACGAPAATQSPTTSTTAPATQAATAPQATTAPAVEATTAPAAEATTEAAAVPSQTFKVKFWEHGPYTRAEMPAEDFQKAYILENYGLDVALEAAPADGGDAKLNALIAAGDLPDIIQGYFSVSNPLFQQWVQQGVLLPVDEYLNSTPELAGLLDDSRWAYLRMDGKTWGVAPPSGPNQSVTWVRQDWLDKLGLKAPTTVEELGEIAKAFAANDPDGNGQADTYGFTSYSGDSNGFERLGSAFAPLGAYPGRNHIVVKDNEAVFTAFSPEAKAALEWWHGLVEAGAVDPDWVTNKFENWRESVAQGKVGIVTAQYQLLREFDGPETLGKEIKAVNPDANWVMLPALKGPAGEYVEFAGSGIGNAFLLTRAAASEPGKAEAIMKFLNDAMNPTSETYRQMAWGRPGADFEPDKDNNPVRRLNTDPERAWMGYYRVFRSPVPQTNKVFFADEPDLFQRWETASKLPLLPNVTSLVPAHEASPDLDTYILEMHTKFALGEESFDNWDSFVETAMSQYRGQEVVDAATEQLRTVGAIK
jgi:putative aldouronate transport system substrate-binding protein